MNILWKPRTRTDLIIIHDSHTGEDVENIHDYLRMQGRRMGLVETGYHLVIDRDGSIHEARDISVIGNAVPGLNHNAVHVCLVGGLGDDMLPVNNITFDQKVALITKVLPKLHHYWPNAKIRGHGELVKFSNKEHVCPCWPPEDIRQDYDMWKATGAIP